ncbi:Z1 domain-containing protein [Mesoterricola silvestris]|uniref:Endonuclease n=1 Tax=Mesoterricola silvestris TaxID=2927979 RepID=A0AA48GPE1_9BACT|nr:Z1 domain-containing protein [Mesoterricola silvestris]BDU71552.1 endonuclease [Mesoterricola silvestris]
MTTEQTIETMAMNVLASQPSRGAGDVREIVAGLTSVMSPPGTAGTDAMIEAISKRIEVRLEITMEDATVIQVAFEPWLEGRRADVEFSYWNRYRRLLGNSLPRSVVGTIDRDTDRIVGLLENPLRPGPWKRRGLGVGEVQSGKTGNYIGVACKAADLGYKFVVLLAGMQNNLRRQTQERVEDGFIGLDTDRLGAGVVHGNAEARTGVGVIDPTFQPISLTTKARDFKNEIAVSANISFSSVNAPIILVVKKQKRVLENLTAWLRSNNRASGGVICGVPMLLLDDEADNASINTRADNDPTQINRLIRELLNQFEQNAYLGYTATPFANIFIDPDTNDQMLQEDLFPRDFIVALDAPVNYVGPSKVFLSEDEPGILREVGDHLEAFPEKHKIDHGIAFLPESLLEAVRSFILTRAIRMLRGATHAHNSMLVNVSRFNSVQGQVTALITDYLTDLRNAVQAHSALPTVKALEDMTMSSLHATWDKEFSSAHDSWPEIQGVLNEAVGPIVVKTINNRSTDTLDYKGRKDDGLNVIAVGGLGLSRGFTLEGLTVSYFIRNSIMYDCLLQMGRWFGYRDGYFDVCRLYMTPDATSWYRHIAGASIELRDEIKRMERENRTPMEFGLKVRAHPDSLIVTARNKMKQGTVVTLSVSLRARLIETVFLRRDSIRQNRQLFERTVARLDSIYPGKAEDAAEGIFWKSVDAEDVKGLIQGWKNHDLNPQTMAGPVIRFLEEHQEKYLSHWDVCLYSPGNEESPVEVSGHMIRPAFRSVKDKADYYQVSGKSSRVASRGNEKAGLSEAEIQEAKEAFKKDHPGKQANVSDAYYRSARQRPLLMLHVLSLEKEDSWVPAWGISFPGRLPEGDTVEYVVNTTWFREQATDEVDEESMEAGSDEG